MGYLLEVTDNKPIDAYVRADANALREYLRGRGLSSESIGRNLTSIRAIVNFVSKEEGLQPPLAFSGVYLGEPTRKADRYVPTATELRLLQARCRSSSDELRWLLALISDTGLRLSEALGLSCEDVCLDTPNPYVVIEPKPWRRLKTSDSERLIPLVGEALWAAQRATDASHTGHLFPSYCDGQNTKANSASAALNKWLKVHVSRDVVVHSLRHAMRDRLRAVECPADIIDQIGGWSRKGVGGELWSRLPGGAIVELDGEGCGVGRRAKGPCLIVPLPYCTALIDLNHNLVSTQKTRSAGVIIE